MNTNWKSFLVEQGARFDQEKIATFKPSDSEDSSNQTMALYDLSEQSIIKVSGADASTFLQNQLSNDINHLNQSNHQESAWCSPKGRIIANFRIFLKDDSYFLIVAHDLIEHVIKKLGMYIMMSKVTLEDVTDSLVHIGISGEAAQDTLQTLLGVKIPTQAGQLVQHNSLSLLRIGSALPRFEIIGDISDAKQLWTLSQPNASKLSSHHWAYLDIVAGLVRISKESSESWIPQMVNYIAIGGVDFKKGCYPGQEVVARLNYLGKTKRRMYRLAIDSDQVPDIGAVIQTESEAEAGKVLYAAKSTNGNVEALAVLKIAEATNPLTLATDKDASISLLDLPYALDESS